MPRLAELLFHIMNVVIFHPQYIDIGYLPITTPHKILYQSFYNFAHVFSGWSGGAEVSCILRHWGIQLILAYIWARPAILIAGKGRGGMFLFLLFLHFHSGFFFFSVPLFHLFYYLVFLFSPFLWEMTQNDPQGLMCH